MVRMSFKGPFILTLEFDFSRGFIYLYIFRKVRL